MSAAECSTVQPRDVVRGLVVLVGFLMVVVGLWVTFATWTVNGWLMLAVVGIMTIFAAQRCPHSLLERGRCFYCTTPVTEAGETANGYGNYGCRCADCTEAWKLAARAIHSRREVS